GFFHLTQMKGNVSEAELQYIIRDHDMEQFIARKKLIEEITAEMKTKYGDDRIVLDMGDQYFNMIEKVKEKFQSVEIAKQALEDVGVKPNIKPIRGGTDGARLSFMGLPCPNIF